MSAAQRPPGRILVVCTRRIGDVLLCTPLIRSLRRAWPQAHIVALVNPGTQGVLLGNPDLDDVLLAPGLGLSTRLRFLSGLWQRYDLALAATGSDRARFLARLAGRRCLGLWSQCDPARGRGWLPGRWLDFDERQEHALESPLHLAAALQIPLLREVVPPQFDVEPGAGLLAALRSPYAVLHPWPRFVYKAWPRERWVGLARALARDGLQVVLTGGRGAEELAFCASLAAEVGGTLDLSGQCDFATLARVLADARVYVGPDTVTTHLAAATGAPTIALFGPSDPVRWGPWPARRRIMGSPWQRVGSQHAGNVWLVQGRGDCVPCLLEGCERHVGSRSRCLDELALTTVTSAVAQALALGSLLSEQP